MKIDFRYKYTAQPESGFSAIAMIIVLMLLGMMILSAFNWLITSWQKSILMEIRHYTFFNHASSSLNWAIAQHWQPLTESWQCQSEPTNQFKSCIKQSLITTDNYTLVRGEYQGFALYTLAHYDGIKLQKEKGHWLDYCPEKRYYDCQ